MQVNRKGIEIWQLSSLEIGLVFNLKGFTIPNITSDCLRASNLAPKWVAGFRHSNSFVARRMSSGRIIFVSFWTKNAVPREIKPGIPNLTITRGQSNFSIVFIFVSYEEKGYYRVALVGQLSFGRRSYCGAQPPYARRRRATSRFVQREQHVLVGPVNLKWTTCWGDPGYFWRKHRLHWTL